MPGGRDTVLQGGVGPRRPNEGGVPGVVGERRG